jgi:hypothetical protein
MKKRGPIILLVLGLFFIMPFVNAGCYRVFVTNSSWSGNLGGLVGTDQKCQAAATAAGLGGIWKAWASNSTLSASQRLVHAGNFPYMTIDGFVVANNWSDLTDGTLQNPIHIVPFTGGYEDYTGGVFTGTDISGLATGADCNGWTSSNSSLHGTAGSSSEVNYYWTGADSPGGGMINPCSNSLRFYCFEQTIFTNGTIKIISNPLGASIWDNGVNTGLTPKTYSVAAGIHEIVLKKEGYYDYTKSYQVELLSYGGFVADLILMPWCNDSDSGAILNVKGTTIDSTGASGIDTCTKSGPLLEYYCDQNKKLTSMIVDCGGYICTGGRCLYNGATPHGVQAQPVQPAGSEIEAVEAPAFSPSGCSWWQRFLMAMGFDESC